MAESLPAFFRVPKPRARTVFHFLKPETLAEWIKKGAVVKSGGYVDRRDRMHQLFGDDMTSLIEELNEVLAA